MTVIDGELSVVIDDPRGDVVDIQPEGLAHDVFSLRRISAGVGCIPLSDRWSRCEASVTRVSVKGGPGDDYVGAWDVLVPARMTGGGGDDLLESGHGTDSLTGGPGIDALVGGQRDDELDGGAGDDFLEGTEGSDGLRGDAGNDVLVAGDSRGDDLAGDAGIDLVRGGSGAGLLDGGAGDDVLVSHAIGDSILAGRGDDTLIGVDDADDVECTVPRRRGGRPRIWGCGSEPRYSAIPRSWPPAAAAGTIAKLRPNDPDTAAWVRRKGDATRYTVNFERGRTKRVWVCVFVYDYAENELKHFSKKVRAKQPKTYTRPAVPRMGWYARVQRGKCD